MDLYSILEIDNNSCLETIKKAYHRLAKKWHPDKYEDKELATKKFQEINFAYEILSNPTEKLKYDKMNNQDKYDFNIVLSQLITKYKNSFVIKYFYSNMTDFEYDLKNNDFEKISESIFEILKNSHICDIFDFFQKKNIKDVILVEPLSCSEKHFIDYNECRCFHENYANTSELDIITKISVSLIDVYKTKIVTSTIKRKINDNYEAFKFRVPILHKYVVFYGFGDEIKGKVGNAIFEINIIKENYEVDKYDIILTKTISLKQLLCGDDFEINFFGISWTLNNYEPLNNNLKFVFENFGLPMSYDYEDRGNLIINFRLDDNELSREKNKFKNEK